MRYDLTLPYTNQRFLEMMNELDTKTIYFCRTTEEWNQARGYIPNKGEIVVYSDYKTIEKDGEQINIPGVKIGSGNAYVQDLAFIDEYESEVILNHIADMTIHVTPGQKQAWSNKLNIDDLQEVVNETLIFNRN